MCCVFTSLVLLGPRAAILFWWLFQPARWELAFDSFFWPFVGFLFAPWTTLMYVAVLPGGGRRLGRLDLDDARHPGRRRLLGRRQLHQPPARPRVLKARVARLECRDSRFYGSPPCRAAMMSKYRPSASRTNA